MKHRKEDQMRSPDRLAQAIADGKCQIGQIRITSTGQGYQLYHIDDTGRETSELRMHTDPADALEISKYDESGEFRFTKGELSLQSGWLYELADADSLLLTLQNFYGAAVSLWFAQQDEKLQVQNLRDKLGRQTGMYRYAGSISDDGAQHLVNTLCGPANKCVKKILWPISEKVPLDDNEASRYEGRLGSEAECIPMLCQEACNFFVAKARLHAKKEFDAKTQTEE